MYFAFIILNSEIQLNMWYIKNHGYAFLVKVASFRSSPFYAFAFSLLIMAMPWCRNKSVRIDDIDLKLNGFIYLQVVVDGCFISTFYVSIHLTRSPFTTHLHLSVTFDAILSNSDELQFSFYTLRIYKDDCKKLKSVFHIKLC